MPEQSVDCIVTSPPYYGLRDYGNDGQYGLEATPAEYVETLRSLFSELRRVLAGDGTLWLNLGDSYADKTMLGIPWRVALALQDDGWLLRNAIIWHKPNGMPDSATDRMTACHENLFMFSKNKGRSWSRDERRQTNRLRRGLCQQPIREEPRRCVEHKHCIIPWRSLRGFPARDTPPGHYFRL